MKSALKWVFTHEPAILAGVIGGVAVFFSLRYGTNAGGALQGTAGGLVLTLFGFLRNYVTSPATKALLDAAPGQIGPIADDVSYLKQFVGEAIAHPGGLVGMFSTHWQQFDQALKDLEDRELGLARSNPVQPSEPITSGGQAVQLKPVTEPAPAAPATDPLTELGKLVNP